MKIYITKETLDKIYKTVGTFKPEQGGMLGMENGIITQFAFDNSGSRTGGTYSPDIAFCNSIIRDWESKNIRFCGFIHSHPSTYRKLSPADKEYAGRIIKAMPQMTQGYLEMPILYFDINNTPRILWFCYKDGKVLTKEIETEIPDTSTIQAPPQRRVIRSKPISVMWK